MPPEVRAIIGKSELVQTLGTTDPAEAKRRHREIMAGFEAQIAAARSQLRGETRSLSAGEIAAIVGEWYRAEVERIEQAPGRPEDRDVDLEWLFQDVRETEDPDDRQFVPAAKHLDEADAMLRARGIAADAATVQALAVQLFGAKTHAAHLAIRRAEGDWSPDNSGRRFSRERTSAPATTYGAPAAVGRVDAFPLTALLEAYAKENPPPQKTLDKRRGVLGRLGEAAGHDDAKRITKADVRAMKEQRISAGRNLKTVADDIAMLRPVWNWGMSNGLLPEGANPFSGMAPKVKKLGPKAVLPYSDNEAARMLIAARDETNFLRWLPWLLAFTGARIEEAAGAMRDDIRMHSGVWMLDINDQGGTRSLKTPQAQRLVPLHPALVAEGFLKYVEGLRSGSPLFPDLALGHYGTRGETATKRHGRWVRQKVGITDEAKHPAHSWRHRLKDALRFAHVPDEAADALLGHDNAANSGAGYGRGWRGRPDELANVLAKVASPVEAAKAQS